MYKPLPRLVKIKLSDIDGMGLFASDEIKKEKLLGITHIKDERFMDGYIRTPLGGFINHSDSPNCELELIDDRFILKTLKDIRSNEELTLKYKLYKADG